MLNKNQLTNAWENLIHRDAKPRFFVGWSQLYAVYMRPAEYGYHIGTNNPLQSNWPAMLFRNYAVLLQKLPTESEK